MAEAEARFWLWLSAVLQAPDDRPWLDPLSPSPANETTGDALLVECGLAFDGYFPGHSWVGVEILSALIPQLWRVGLRLRPKMLRSSEKGRYWVYFGLDAGGCQGVFALRSLVMVLAVASSMAQPNDFPEAASFW